jgi:hypothetical protein
VKIPLTLKPLLPAGTTQVGTLLQQLQPGQLLQAKVLGQVRPSVLKLQIATLEILARSPVSLTPGTKLQLEVTRTIPQPLLRILREPTMPDTVQRERAVRHAMPRQVPLSETHRAVEALRANATTPGQAELADRVATILRDAAVKPHQVSPAAVQKALHASGLFLEARLAQGAPFVAPDLKLGLLKLLRALTGKTSTTPSDGTSPNQDTGETRQARAVSNEAFLQRLVRLIESAVARVQLNQAASLPAEESPRQAWQIDLPVHTGNRDDDIQLRIERDSAQDGEDGGAGWSVNLVFEFDSIGRLKCRIGLNGDRVAASFWCANDATHVRLQQRLPVLEKGLQAQGLEVVHMSSRLGDPGDDPIRISVPTSLLDERA